MSTPGGRLPDLSRLALHKSAETDVPLIAPLLSDYDITRSFYLHVMHADEASADADQPDRVEVGKRLHEKTEKLRKTWNDLYHQETKEFEPRLQFEPDKSIQAIADERSGGVLIAILLPSALEETGQAVLADPRMWQAIFKRCNKAFLLAREAMYGRTAWQKDAAKNVVMPVVFLSDVDFSASGETALASRKKALSDWYNRKVTKRALATLRRENTPALRYFMMARQLALMHMIKHQAATYARVLIESPPAYAWNTKTQEIVLGATPEFPLYLGDDKEGADEALTASLRVLIARHLATFTVRRAVFTDKLLQELLGGAHRWLRFPIEMFNERPTLDDEWDADVDRAMETARQAREDRERDKRRQSLSGRSSPASASSRASSRSSRPSTPLTPLTPRSRERDLNERASRAVRERQAAEDEDPLAEWWEPALEFGAELLFVAATDSW